MAKLRLKAWWLEPGTEICPGCHHLYLYETEYRCADCDGPTCSDCVREQESLTMVCPACVTCDDKEGRKLEVS